MIKPESFKNLRIAATKLWFDTLVFWAICDLRIATLEKCNDYFFFGAGLTRRGNDDNSVVVFDDWYLQCFALFLFLSRNHTAEITKPARRSSGASRPLFLVFGFFLKGSKRRPNTLNRFRQLTRFQTFFLCRCLGPGIGLREQNRITRQTLFQSILSQISNIDNYIVWGRVIVCESLVARTDRLSLTCTCAIHAVILMNFWLTSVNSINYLFLLQPKQHF